MNLDIRVQLEERAIIYRGRVMHFTSIMEKMIDLFITVFLCKPGRERDMQMFILGDNRMSLETKRQVFNAICKRYFESWGTVLPGKWNVSLNKALGEIIEERNKFAHLVLSYSEEAEKEYLEKGVITFLRFKDDLKPFRYDDETFQDLHEKIIHVTEYIYDGIGLLGDS